MLIMVNSGSRLRQASLVACNKPARIGYRLKFLGTPMKNALQEFLEAIRFRFEHQLNDLGVEAKAKRKYGGQFIEFTGDGRYVPVNIMLKPGVLLPQSKLRLEECTLLQEKWYPVPVGTNGWIFYEYSRSDWFELSGKPEQDFAKISETISRAGVVRNASIHEKVTANGQIALAYEEITKELEPRNIREVKYTVTDGIESLNFADAEGKEWTLGFNASRVKISVDGKSVGLVEHDDRFEMREIIRSRLDHIRLSKKW